MSRNLKSQWIYLNALNSKKQRIVQPVRRFSQNFPRIAGSIELLICMGALLGKTRSFAESPGTKGFNLP